MHDENVCSPCCSPWSVPVAAPAALARQEEDPHAAETKPQVPALNKFHTPIYKLWHTAWPKKDTAMMAMLTPDIDKGIAEVAQAELPGILRDKKAVWEENVKLLQAVGGEYREAMAGDRPCGQTACGREAPCPVRKTCPYRAARHEGDRGISFGAVHALPLLYARKRRWTRSGVRGRISGSRMDSLNAATLPERLKKREEAFVAARAALSASVDAVNAAVNTNDEKKIKDAITVMHSDYEKLEKVFE